MADKKEEKIKKRAYELWEAEGRPENRHHEHWSKAKQEHGGAKKPTNGASDAKKKTSAKPAPKPAIEKAATAKRTITRATTPKRPTK